MAKKANDGRRMRRSHSQLFIDKLTELWGGKQQLIGNKSVREALGWDLAKYNRIRSELLDQGKIIVGRGYGGTVSLASAPGTKALTVFISYSHVDELYKLSC